MSNVAMGIVIAISAAVRAAMANRLAVLAVLALCSTELAALKTMFLALRAIRLAFSARLPSAFDSIEEQALASQKAASDGTLRVVATEKRQYP